MQDIHSATVMVETAPAPAAADSSETMSTPDNAMRPAVQPEHASLIVLKGPNAGSTIVLEHSVVVLGRDTGRWLRLSRNGGMYSALSLDPTVLVTRNGSPLPPTPQQLEDGDAIGMDEFSMVFTQTG